MKWWAWIILAYVAFSIILWIWFLVDEEKDRKRVHRACEKIRQAHRSDKVEKGIYTAQGYIYCLELLNHID